MLSSSTIDIIKPILMTAEISDLDKEVRHEHLQKQCKLTPADETEFSKVTAGLVLCPRYICSFSCMPAYKILTDKLSRQLYDSAKEPINYETPPPGVEFFGAYDPLFRHMAR